MTFCSTCRWLGDDAKGMHWSRWTCQKTENHETNPVSGTIEPRLLCRFVNYGACTEWEAGPNSLSPKPTTQEPQ